MIQPYMLHSRLALVTGGGNGIGRAVCNALATHGAAVVVVDINKDAAVKTCKGLDNPDKHIALHCDITSKPLLEQLLEQVIKTYERPPGILVNCAGVTMDRSLHKMQEEEFDWVLNVNLRGPFLLTQLFTKYMVVHKVQHGSVINVSSIVGKTGNFGQTNYAAAKSGLIGLTKTVARELGKYNIRCNAILPGFIDTSMTKKVPEPVLDSLKQLTPLGRCGKPEEVADVCVFLASDMSRFMTGACVEVTGGLFM